MKNFFNKIGNSLKAVGSTVVEMISGTGDLKVTYQTPEGTSVQYERSPSPPTESQIAVGAKTNQDSLMEYLPYVLLIGVGLFLFKGK